MELYGDCECSCETRTGGVVDCRAAVAVGDDNRSWLQCSSSSTDCPSDFAVSSIQSYKEAAFAADNYRSGAELVGESRMGTWFVVGRLVKRLARKAAKNDNDLHEGNQNCCRPSLAADTHSRD